MQNNNHPMDLQHILAEFRDGLYRIGVFGEFSTGKSTFLNALMGEDILSVATEPTTATPTRIQWARAFNVLVYGKPTSPGAEPRVIASQFPVGAEPVWARLMKDGVLATLQHETTSIRRFLERWTKEGQDADQTYEVLIQLPQPFLKGRLALVDTPGVNNEFTKHQGITERVLEGVDLALCLVDARQGGKASEMRFIQSVVERASQTRVVVNKIDLVAEDEREELLASVHATMQRFWPTDRGECPVPWMASPLASLDPSRRARMPKLADAFDSLRMELNRLTAQERPRRILERNGKWDQTKLAAARDCGLRGEHAQGHEMLMDVLTLYQEAEIVLPESLTKAIESCEKTMQGATAKINDAHALVDQAALILLRSDKPTEEAKNLLRQAGEFFLKAHEKDPAFEKLARQALGVEALQYLFIGADPEAICEEAHAYFSNEEATEPDLKRWLDFICPLAEGGYPRAQDMLGMCHYHGVGVRQDLQQAASWFRKAAEQGYSSAQFNLGACLESGIGVDKDSQQAIAWFRKSAEQGDADAQASLGNFYNAGQGVGQDSQLAAEWYRKAAEQGKAEAQYELGILLSEGNGVTKDERQAEQWVQRAANAGFEKAKQALSDISERFSEYDFESVIFSVIRPFQGQTDLFIHPNIPNNKLSNAKQTCLMHYEEKVLALVDATVFGSAKNALIFGTRGIYYHNDSISSQPGANHIPYEILAKFEYTAISEASLGLGDGNSFDCSGSSCKSNILIEILNQIKRKICSS